MKHISICEPNRFDLIEVIVPVDPNIDYEIVYILKLPN
jgi:hypothetical protein